MIDKEFEEKLRLFQSNPHLGLPETWEEIYNIVILKAKKYYE